MLFNSFEFLLFLPIVFLLYWFVFGQYRPKCLACLPAWSQNAFIVLVSYVFYGWWDWRFLLLIAFTSFCSWVSGLLIEKYRTTPSAVEGASKLLVVSDLSKFISVSNIVFNLAILGVFKYFNFFVDSFVSLFAEFGIALQTTSLNIILPVGISFYTFQALSYSIDVYRQKIEPTRNVVDFFAFVSFFPQLVAGPIERATNLLPQFQKTRAFSYEQAVDGCRQMLWGFFKKIVIADNCAVYVNQVWESYGTQSGSTLLLAAVLFAFQIYGDFSGYSDIAIGCSKLFGITLKRNFNVPYFSRDIAEFWRRWHISLTTWFRDYIYIPLGGSRVNKAKVVRNTFIIFLVSGLWHGANWTFVVWGAYHAVFFLPLILLGKNRKYTDVVAAGKILPNIREFFQILFTFLLVVIGWIIFRAENIAQAWEFVCGIFNKSLLSVPQVERLLKILIPAFGIAVMLFFEWKNRSHPHGMSVLPRPVWLRWVIYYCLAAATILTIESGQEFIYFQF